MMNDNNRKRIASLALFRHLYNGHSDVISILAEFCKLIIQKDALTAFSATEIKQKLLLNFDFVIPDSVVETVLKRFCKKDNGIYMSKPAEIYIANLLEELRNLENNTESVLSQLSKYVEEKLHKELTQNDKNEIIQNFCRFLIEDDTEGEYSDYISAFIINNQKEDALKEQLKKIKEGVILYTGIKYNDNINDVGSWKFPYTIYVEQEILFHLAGYNGDLFKQLFEDFYSLIKEINNKAKKQLIKIKYHTIVKNEIDKFFYNAERIIEKKMRLDYSNQAMTLIVQGCESISDVVTKKAKFFDTLKQYHIEEDNTDYYTDQSFSQYNIETATNIEQLVDILGCTYEEFEQNLKLLNFVNVLRKDSTYGFDKSKCILLTGNLKTLSISTKLKDNGLVPLATTLDFITNRLWIKLNKGFGNSNNNYPKTFDVVTKAQIILSSRISGSVAKEFEKIDDEIKQGKSNNDIIVTELAELKSKLHNPEDINESNTDEVIDTIENCSLERYLREKEIEKEKTRNLQLENSTLQAKIEDSHRIITEKDDQINAEREEKEQLKKEYHRNLSLDISRIESKKCKADKVSTLFTFVAIFLSVLILIYLFKRLIDYFKWDIIEPWTWLGSIIFSYIFGVIYGKSFRPRMIFNRIKCLIQKIMYKLFQVDLKKLNELKNKLAGLM